MNEFVNEIKNKVNNIKSKIRDDRRYIHANPELSFCEYNTSSYICNRLDNLNISYSSPCDGTDVVAYIPSHKPTDKTILLRADIDALPLTEKSTSAYSSKINGVMHACGHDVHTAIMLGVCEVLSEFKNKLCVNVKIVFQPGEETEGGALPLIEKGVLENPNVDCCIALHVDPDIESGKVRIKKGVLYASPDEFEISITGKSGHGAEPELCINPITCSAEIISKLEEFNHNLETGVVSVCTVNGGSANNIIPDSIKITGTARSLSNETRRDIKAKIDEICCEICDKRNAKYEYLFKEMFPPLINDNELCDKFYIFAKKCIGENNCIIGGNHTMAGEDFAYFAQIKPSVLFKLGCRNERLGIVHPIHNSEFDVDEECLFTGVTLVSGFVLNYPN